MIIIRETPKSWKLNLIAEKILKLKNSLVHKSLLENYLQIEVFSI